MRAHVRGRAHLLILLPLLQAPSLEETAPAIPRAVLEGLTHSLKDITGVVVHYNSVVKDPRASPWIFIDPAPGCPTAVGDNVKPIGKVLRQLRRRTKLQFEHARRACDAERILGHHATADCRLCPATDIYNILLTPRFPGSPPPPNAEPPSATGPAARGTMPASSNRPRREVSGLFPSDPPQQLPPRLAPTTGSPLRPGRGTSSSSLPSRAMPSASPRAQPPISRWLTLALEKGRPWGSRCP